MKQNADRMHNELLELISTLSDSTLSDRSSIFQTYNGSQNRQANISLKILSPCTYTWLCSSTSFCMLPSKPEIFHGRDFELEEIINTLSRASPRIAILGGGGMGKTTLAKAVLHHPKITSRFKHKLFVNAESTSTSVELAALIGLHLGLKPGKDLTKSVVRYLSGQTSCLLILDNIETPWEPMESRRGVEQFLSLLTDISRLALIVCVPKRNDFSS